jgi:hypothetical protein
MPTTTSTTARQLLRVAVEQAGDALRRADAEVLGRADAVPALAVAAVREQADREEAPGAVDAVDADRADRVVDLDLVEEADGPDDQHAGDAPMMNAPTGDTNAQGDVIATRPASMLLHIIDGSGLPVVIHM